MAKKKVASRTSFVDPSKVGRRDPEGTTRIHQGSAEAMWNCTSCGRSNIPGFTKICLSCGNPRDIDETYQPPINPKKAKMLSAEELMSAGVTADHLGDQQCGYCGYFSQPGTSICPSC